MTTTPTTLVIGDDWLWQITIQDQSGHAVDLTNYTLAGEFYTPFANGPADVTVANGRIVLTNLTAGQFFIRLEDALTRTVRPQPSPTSSSRVQVFITDASGNRTTVGVLPITPITALQA